MGAIKRKPEKTHVKHGYMHGRIDEDLSIDDEPNNQQEAKHAEEEPKIHLKEDILLDDGTAKEEPTDK